MRLPFDWLGDFHTSNLIMGSGGTPKFLILTLRIRRDGRGSRAPEMSDALFPTPFTCLIPFHRV